MVGLLTSCVYNAYDARLGSVLGMYSKTGKARITVLFRNTIGPLSLLDFSEAFKAYLQVTAGKIRPILSVLKSSWQDFVLRVNYRL